MLTQQQVAHLSEVTARCRFASKFRLLLIYKNFWIWNKQ